MSHCNGYQYDALYVSIVNSSFGNNGVDFGYNVLVNQLKESQFNIMKWNFALDLVCAMNI